ncbi:MAG: hypothetical protein FJ271_24220 [Planctomycetes bacterium]|nr:hypothetical protein [Planctomycetota bacterium]
MRQQQTLRTSAPLRSSSKAMMRGTWLAILVGLVSLQQAHAQPFPRTRLATVTPPGARAGSSVEVVLEGADLEDIASLHFSHPGIKAERVPDPPPPKKKPKTPPKYPIKFKIIVPASVPLGIHDVRAIGKWGISNPRAVTVGSCPEVLEQENNDDVPRAQKVAMNSIVNGKIGSNVDVDYYAFPGKKGERVVIHCAASSIDSRLEPLLQLFDRHDRKLASNRDYRGRDAVLDAVLPGDGEYLVRVCQFAYILGGPESFYRLSIGTTPWIDSVYPAVVEAGKASTITVFGRNLPGGEPAQLQTVSGRPLEKVAVQVTPPPPADVLSFSGTLLPRFGMMAGFEQRLKNAAGVSNPILLTYAQGPVVLDDADNTVLDSAQKITVPCDICGRIEKTGDHDYFRFTAKKGDVYYLEGYADRLGAPLDLYLRIIRADDRKVVAEFDDHPDIPDRSGQFWTYTSDPKGRFVAPADGDYVLLVTSRTAATRAGARFVYQVSIRAARPDFHLLVVGNHDAGGGGFTLQRGGSQDLQVVCLRQDDFQGEIALQAEGLPSGVTCAPQVIGPKMKETVLILRAAANAPLSAGEIQIKGTSVIANAKVTRQARAGTLVWPLAQKNAPAISRLARAICLSVRDKGPFAIDTPATELLVPAGGKLDIKILASRQWPEFKAPIQITRISAPVAANGNFINVPNVTIAPKKADAVVKLTVPANTEAGVFTLAFQGTGKFTYQPDPKDKKKRTVDFSASSPALKLTVFKEVAELSLPKSPLVLKPGNSFALDVKLARLHQYKGPFTVELVQPSGFKGLSGPAVTVPAGGNDARLILKVDPKAKPANSAGFLVRATAKIDNVTLKQEAKLQLIISNQPDAKGEAVDLRTVKLLAAGSDGWRYLPAAAVRGNDWLKPDFDDKNWKSVRAPFGNGEGEIAARKGTEIPEKGQPILCRRLLQVPAEVLSQKGTLFELRVASDDSAEIYLNGQLVDKDEADHEFSYWNRELTVPAELFRPGRNVMAVLVHNSTGSSDVYLDMELSAQVVAPQSKK